MLNLEKLKKEQTRLAKKIITKDSFQEITKVAGAAQTFFDKKIISALVVCEYTTLQILEKKYVIQDATFPYLPGFLSYREGPALIECFHSLEKRPEILLVNGHGLLHPLKIGVASHVGLLLDQVTIGVAEKLITGIVQNDYVYMEDEIRGYKFLSREFARPIYISPGYKISLKTSVEVVKKCMKFPHKLPEPLYIAHRYAREVQKKLQ